MDFITVLGNKVKEIRISLNLSQEDFVSRLNINITRASISKIESGKQMPSAEFIKSVVEKYNVSPYWLLDIDIISNNDISSKYDLLSNTNKDTLNKYLDFLIDNSKSNLLTWENTEKEENKKSS